MDSRALLTRMISNRDLSGKVKFTYTKEAISMTCALDEDPSGVLRGLKGKWRSVSGLKKKRVIILEKCPRIVTRMAYAIPLPENEWKTVKVITQSGTPEEMTKDHRIVFTAIGDPEPEGAVSSIVDKSIFGNCIWYVKFEMDREDISLNIVTIGKLLSDLAKMKFADEFEALNSYSQR